MPLATPYDNRASHLVIAFASAMMAGCRRESRSKQDALVALAEIRGILDLGNVTSTQTPIGRKLELLAHCAQEVQRNLRSQLTMIDADALLKPERLSSAEGIERSLRDADALRRVDKWYFSQVEQLLLDFDVWALQQFGRSLGDQSRLRSEARELLERSIAVHEAIGSLLRFVQATQPALRDGILVFPSRSECVRYEALLRGIETRSQMLEAHQLEVLRRRRASLN
jgi:hypothetical protein